MANSYNGNFTNNAHLFGIIIQHEFPYLFRKIIVNNIHVPQAFTSSDSKQAIVNIIKFKDFEDY